MRKKHKTSRINFGVIFWMLLIVAATYFAVPAVAVPPSPELQERLAHAGLTTTLASGIPMSADLHERGVCTPDNFFSSYLANRKQVDASASPTAGGFKILALLVKFSDHPSSVAPAFFDFLLFDSSGASTVKKYFNEISNTQIDLVTVNLPSSVGWNTAPQTYAYYVNGQNGTGSYPQNSQKLVEDLVDLVNPSINFANYDNNGDGYVDCLLVIHSGTGAEVSGNGNDIWSHKWGLYPGKLVDGVRVSTYTVQPEFWNTPGDMTIGVYAHELCHGFGLPDLYDTNPGNGNSYGAGKWCIMAYGCWNGSPQGSSPSHPCAWSRIQMGITTPTVVSANLTSQTIAPVETGGTIYRLWTSGTGGNEYFLVENRQKTLYDTYLPASGLLIWHIDDGKTSNASAWYPGLDSTQHYLVALEQADGAYHLEHATNYGDAADPFPGSGNKTTFSSLTSPNSNAYTSGATTVAVTSISSAGSNIIANLIVGLVSGVDDGNPVVPNHFSLFQNYPNPFNPSTVIAFELSAPADVRLDIYDMLGRRVRTLFDGTAAVGETVLSWDGTNSSNQQVASGVYVYRLAGADGTELSKKMVLVR